MSVARVWSHGKCCGAWPGWQPGVSSPRGFAFASTWYSIHLNH